MRSALDEYLERLKGKRVAVLGIGVSNRPLIDLLCQAGIAVTACDKRDRDSFNGLIEKLEANGVSCHLGPDYLDHLDGMDVIFRTPGLRPDLPQLERAKAAGAELTSEMEAFFSVCPCRILAVTGSDGKTTTTTLVGEIFKNDRRNTYVVGNIGVAVISKALDTEEGDWLITETSSFQLQTVKYFKPVISAILNITPDHLNRHHTMENYGCAKANIFVNQDEKGYCIINGDDEMCRTLAKKCKARVMQFSSTRQLKEGAFVKDGRLVIADGQKIYDLCGADELKIIGKHNIENALAASAISYFAGIDPVVIGDTLKSFSGVAHRIEYCGMIDGVKFYNDSKGTNIDATVTALNAIKENIILIAGGDGKGQDFKALTDNFAGRVKHLVLIGRDGPKIAAAAEESGFRDYSYGANMEECVQKAFSIAREGDTVLLSPACASWDMYDNFEQRGEHFKEVTARLDN